MKVLIACEFSGIVREAFRKRGHDAWSCDLLPTEVLGGCFHFRDNVLKFLGARWKWDLMIAHPPCTHLSVSGARWFKDKVKEQAEALDFVRKLLAAPIDKIALENPISVISSKIRKPDQIIQPWQFGHGETKATCLWLKNLPKLVPTNIVEGREGRVWKASPGPDRRNCRSYGGAVGDSMSSETKYFCDICGNTAKHLRKSVHVCQLTEQTEGRNTTPYLEERKIDLCEKCEEKLIVEYPLTSAGAQGYFKYKWRNP